MPGLFEGIAPVYDAYRGGYSEPAITYIRERAALGPSSAVLDLACGTGLVVREFAGNCLYGLDIDGGMLRQAKGAMGDQVNFVLGHGEKLPFAPCTFDLITIGQSIHWFDLFELIPELSRTLRPGGWLAVISKYPSPHEPIRPLYERLIAGYCDPCTAELTSVKGVGNVLGLEGFSAYERRVFPWVLTFSIDAYLAGVAKGRDVAALSAEQAVEFMTELESELRKLTNVVNDGDTIQELYYDYVIMARRGTHGKNT